MTAQCQCCNAEWPEDFLVELELVDGDTNEACVKTICQSCAEEIQQNTLELEDVKVFEPRHVISPYLLFSSSSFFNLPSG